MLKLSFALGFLKTHSLTKNTPRHKAMFISPFFNENAQYLVRSTWFYSAVKNNREASTLWKFSFPPSEDFVVRIRD